VRQCGGALILQREDPAEQQVGAEVSRFERQRRPQFVDRIGNPIDPRINRSQ
jgi:hypothetical protein